MLLAHKTKIKINDNYANIRGHMCYAAYKLWNVCNYERHHYKELNLPVRYPDWYYQKKHIRMICGTDNSRPRQLRKYASFLTSHGSPTMRLKGLAGLNTQDLRGSKMTVLP